MTGVILAALLVVYAVSGVLAGDYCENSDESDETFYCASGCCGSKGDQHCCVNENLGKILGIVIGCVVLAAIIVTTVLVFCCCVKKGRTKSRKTGHVNQANGEIPLDQFSYQPSTVNLPMSYPTAVNYPNPMYTRPDGTQQPVCGCFSNTSQYTEQPAEGCIHNSARSLPQPPVSVYQNTAFGSEQIPQPPSYEEVISNKEETATAPVYDSIRPPQY